ncbi:hypothetical protein H0A36_15845 [Endozoicomonas sp. SM1973]|uniref:DUF2157 domain-containing protein n=1 Tax=Spartinivicinus marinus TaxID=2994442 RepID=A0A853I0I3_9GAMM|nr:hypothetical protein [Spartinivicinus marinus]MCX4029840.1 hypothetical protein [Spartinivicinus marinus]NYZ67490.1 hypothetical protein [Spartinivicinus marinus]
MYTDEDLNYAIDKGIFTEASVTAFREQLSRLRSGPAVDEENFRLVTSFNDIFVVIACSLLLFSSWWVIQTVNDTLGMLVFTVLSWGLAEFFVLKKRMALPAILLLLSFVPGIFLFSVSVLPLSDGVSFMTAAGITVIATYIHWRRFNVPITIATGTAVAVGFLVTMILAIFPGMKEWYLSIFFVFGILVFVYAMYWDASDRSRTSRRSDVAFWLHLLSAPLIIHPAFSGLGILSGSESLVSMAIVICLYLLLTFISIVIDRRAFMVSSLIYVVYALSSLLKTYGIVSYSFAFTGVVIGAALLLLSAFWHPTRVVVISFLPSRLKNYCPEVNVIN